MTSSNDQVVLYGGQGDIFASLNLSAGDMPYLMLETAEYGIQFCSTAEYAFTPEWTVLRLHAFGSGGELLIRRDEDRIFWRFVGKQSVFVRLGLDGTQFPKVLHYNQEDVERSLVWGKYDAKDIDDVRRGYRYEARVGKVELNYPDVPLDWERIEIHARRVLDTDNQIIAYWTYELAKHDSS
jgi:hypothetical protein